MTYPFELENPFGFVVDILVGFFRLYIRIFVSAALFLGPQSSLT